MLEKEDAVRRHEVRRSALDYIGQKLRLKSLDIMFCTYVKCSMVDIDKRGLKMQWVESLIAINELEGLNVEMHFAEPVDHMFSLSRMQSNATFQIKFTAYLESKMFKSKSVASAR